MQEKYRCSLCVCELLYCQHLQVFFLHVLNHSLFGPYPSSLKRAPRIRRDCNWIIWAALVRGWGKRFAAVWGIRNLEAWGY